MKRLLSIICIILVLTIGLSSSVLAEPTDSFVHVDTIGGTQTTVMTREMYKSAKTITSASLGLPESFNGLSDLCCDSEDNIYILVGGRSQIVKLNPDYSYNATILFHDETGEQVKFEGAQGVYIDKNMDIYVCDSEHEQIIIADQSGAVKKYLKGPDSSLMPDNFLYQPYKMARDDKGYTYVLSLGCYYGALAYSPDDEFLGFYGANSVNASALDMLATLWDKLTQTDTKKSYSTKALPYSFVDLAIDSEGYMVTCTGKTETETNGTGQIRKLSPGGSDILYKRGTDGSSQSSQTLNFLEEKVLKVEHQNNPQNYVAIDTDDQDFIYALDQTYGFVYIFDSECNMLGGFGGKASDNAVRKGVFQNAVSLQVHGDSILVADANAQTITVFEVTEYGKLLKEAQTTYIKGDYDTSDDLWNKVLSYDRNNQLAYRGLAMSALTREEYDVALDYAEKGIDYTVYDMAWQKIISRWISDNFVWVFGLAILVIGGLIAFFVIIKKKGIVLVKNIKVKTALNTTFHPFDSFADVKYKKRGSLIISAVILFLYYFANVLEKTASGFLFLKSSPRTYNTIYTLLGTVGVVILWCVANWLVACLSSGNGNLKEVVVATSYALIPLVVYTYIRVILSQFLPLTGLSVMDGIKTVILIFTFFLLAVGIMAVHEYDFFKFLTTSIVSLIFMLLIVFVFFLVGVLLQQAGEFVSTLFSEMFFR